MSFRRQQHNRDVGSNDNNQNRHRHRSSDNSGTSRNTTLAGGTSRNSNRFGRSWSTRSAHASRNRNNNRSGQNDDGPTLASTPRRATSARTMSHQRNTTSSGAVGNAQDTTNTTITCSEFLNGCDDGSNGASSCVICMDELKGRLGVANPCGHVFHQECYGSWDVQSFEGSSDDEDDDSTSAGNRRRPTKCPTCRSNITVFTHIHELVGQIQFGEIIPPSLQTATATTTITTPNGEDTGSSESANRVSPNASDNLSSFIRKNLDDVRGISSLDEGKIVDMEVDSLFAEVSDLRSQVASLESILKSSQEQHEETVRKAHTDQEHLARGMVDLSENNEQLRKELRKVEELYESMKAENTLLRSEVEQGTTVMNELLLRESEHNNNTNNSSHYEGYHGFQKHSFT